MDRVLRGAALAAVVGMGVPPAMEIAALGQETQRNLAFALLVLAAVAGIYAAVRRQPLAARATTVAYGVFGIGLGLFASAWSIASLVAYIVGLMGMNVLLYHASAYGPVLAAFRDEDAVSRRARAVVLKSLGISGAVLAVSYGGSLALLPLFALEIGSRDPLMALVLATGLVVTLLVVAVLPETPRLHRRTSLR